MKIRTGFVSNSSSSSFVVVTTKENYEKCLNEADQLTKDIVKAIGYEKETIFGRDCYVISSWNDASGSGAIGNVDVEDPEFESDLVCEKIDYDEDFEWQETWDNFCDLLEDNKEETHVFCVSDGG